MHRVLLTLVLVGILGSQTYPAAAQGNGDGPQAADPPTAADHRVNADKLRVAKQFMKHRLSNGSIEAFAPQIEALERRLNGGQPIDGGVTSPRGRSGQGGIVIQSHTADAYTYPAYQLQINNWYCGPASAWAALAWKGYGNSYLGQSLTQSNLASSGWLNTINCPNNPCGTGFGTNWTHTLNAWGDGTDAGWYARYVAPSAATVEYAIHVDLNFNWLPVFDVYMNSTRGFLPGYSPTYTEVWHYVVGMGYSNYGQLIHWVDPWSAISPGYNYNLASSSWSSLMGSPYGMIW